MASSNCMKWTSKHDDILVREIIAQSPWIHKRGSPERGLTWGKIAESLNTFKNPIFRVSQRSVRDRYALLEKKHKIKVRSEDRASGIVPEETEVDQALEDIITQFRESDMENDRASSEKKAKLEAEVGIAQEMRQKSLETFKETQKRNETLDDEEPTRRKKKRASGSDAMSFLKEKAEMEMDLRAQEIDLRRQEIEKEQELKAEEIKIRKQDHKEKQEQQHRMSEQMMGIQRMQQQQLQQLMQQQQQQSAVMITLLQKALDK